MRRPIYTGCEGAILTETSHRGLWFERFFNQYEQDGNNWKIVKGDERKKIPEGKKAWIEEVVGQFGQCGDCVALNSNASRQIEMVKTLGGESKVIGTSWNFVTGMGLPNPVENGLAWHPTLGVPYLAGSGVKGLLRAWVEEWMEGFDDTGHRLKLRQSWFGMHKGDLGDDVDAAGDLIFFDAIPVAPVELTMDIMTPHMGKWYEKGGKIANAADEPKNTPADWHDPVPVPFLAVRKADFLFSIAPSRRLEDKAELKKALNAFVEAIEMLGAGAKTAVGYGRMETNEGALALLQAEMQKKI